MIELLAIAGGGSFALVTFVTDFFCDGPPNLAARAETLRVLSAKMVAAITVTRRDDTKRIDAWLREHAGTTELSDEDKLFFATQLELARREVGTR